MTTADRIRERREALGLSQTDLALKMGLSGKSSIARIETMGDKVTLKNVEKCAKALNCSPTYLLGFEGDKTDLIIPTQNVIFEDNLELQLLIENCQKLDSKDIETLNDMATVLVNKKDKK